NSSVNLISPSSSSWSKYTEVRTWGISICKGTNGSDGAMGSGNDGAIDGDAANSGCFPRHKYIPRPVRKNASASPTQETRKANATPAHENVFQYQSHVLLAH